MCVCVFVCAVISDSINLSTRLCYVRVCLPILSTLSTPCTYSDLCFACKQQLVFCVAESSHLASNYLLYSDL